MSIARSRCPVVRRVLVSGLIAMAVSARAAVLPPGTYSFRTYGAESGLGNLSAMRLAQDATGFIWVATQEGVYRYDGARFERFGLEEGLPSTFAAWVSAAANGEVWVATNRGVARFDGRRFQAVKSLPASPVNALAIDAGNRVWVALPEGLYTNQSGSFVAAAGWPAGEEATAIWCDLGSGDVFAAAEGRVGRLHAGRWTWWPVGGARIDAVVFDTTGRIWARSGTHLWSKAMDEPAFRDESAALPGTSTNGYLSLDRRGNLWVATDRGLAVRDASGWRVLTQREGLPTNWSRDVLEDSEGSIWIASLGVHRMLGRGEFTSYELHNGLPNDVIWTFHWDRRGHLLVGTDLGLARSEHDGWSVVEGTEAAQIRTVVEDDGGRLWAAGQPAQVIRFDPAAPPGQRVRRYGAADGVVARGVLSMVRGRDGTLWAGTRGGGLLQKRAGADRFVRVELPRGTATETFRGVIEDSKGRIWAAGERGLACLAGGVWRRFGREDGLAGDDVSYLLETRAGDVWVAYFEPLGASRVRIDEKSRLRVVERLHSGNGLASGKVYFLGEDVQRRLWVGTGTGVNVVGSAGIEHYGTADGLAGDDTDANAFLSDERGHVFIGTSSGFSQYVPHAVVPRRAPPPVRITSATLGGLAIRPDVRTEVDRKRSDFAVRFAALTYFKEDLLEYQTRLVGLDDEWRSSSRPEVQFARLPASSYRFEVRARLRPGAWSAPAAVAFAVRPAWWQTATAKAGAAALLIALLTLGFRWRVAMLRSRNLELQTLVEQRTKELAAAADSLREMSVTDPLTGMRNRRYLQLSMPEHAGDAVRRHASLLRAGVDPARSNADLLFFMVDLDRFKEVNDRHGHAAGDCVLSELHRLLASIRRESDTLARWGGEEFLFIARNASRAEAGAIAERIRSTIADHLFLLPDGVPVRLTCSIGFAPFPFLPEDPSRLSWEDVVDLADACLYAAKRAGRDAWVGMTSRDCRAPETLVARLRASMAMVVAGGEVDVQSSGDSSALQWEAPRASHAEPHSRA